MGKEIAYEIIRKTVTDRPFLKSLLDNPYAALKKEGLTDSKEISEVKEILNVVDAGMEQESELGKFITNQLKSTAETAETFKKGLGKTVEQIDKGFRSTMLMYETTFGLGILLIFVSLIFAIFRTEALLPLVFGGFGTADLIGFFLTKPPQDLQSSRADLAQLQASFFNWFTDTYNWNSFLKQLSEKDELDFDKLKQVSATLLENTSKTMELIEKYCEFEKRHGK